MKKLTSLFAFCLCLIFLLTPVQASQEAIQACIPNPETERGIIVIIGDTDAGSLANLAKVAPVVILVVKEDAESSEKLNAELLEAGVYGQVSAISVGEGGRIPLADNTVAKVIAGKSEVPVEEARRITRPLGTIYHPTGNSWEKETKPRPEGAADWTHYNGDPQNSQHSQDLLVGPPRGMQWLAGPTNKLDFLLIGGHVILGRDRKVQEAVNSQSLIARDAFSGLPLWIRKDSEPNNRWCAVFDGNRLYYHGKTNKSQIYEHTLVLDSHTGETLQTLSEGLNFFVSEEEIKRNRRSLQEQAQRAFDMQLRLSDNILIQAIREEIVALDVITGKRLWSNQAPEKSGYTSPTIGEGKLYLVQGEYVRHSSYTHWPMAKPEKVLALDLKTGEPIWELEWDEEKYIKPHAVYNLQYENGILCAAVTGYVPEVKKDANRPRPHGLVLNAKDGKVLYFGREEKAWPGTTGHGHSHVRMHLRDKKAWSVTLGGPLATWSIDQPQNFFDVDKHWQDQGAGMRPVSCTVWRSTDKYWFGGLGIYPLSNEGEGYFNRSGRSDCDIGAFPANGLLYSPPNTCQCQPYLPGTKAYHSRKLGSELPDASRRRGGSAKPAAAKGDPKTEWPQWAQSPARRFWSEQHMPTDLEQKWQIKIEASKAPDLIASQWERDAVIQGPITATSVAEGVVVFGKPHSHEVVALDAASGRLKWTTQVDGRIDLSPTIHQGMVLFGTRNGYVYALNRETGETIWRFTAAPLEDRVVVNGQLESPWPVFGAVPVNEQGVFAIAGRHSSNDGGLWWWRLDPQTGKILGKGPYNDGEGTKQAANWVNKLRIDHRPIQNTVAVLSKNTLQMVGQPLLINELDEGRATENKFLTWEDFEARQFEEKVIRSGRNAIIGERQQTVGGWKKAHYANTLARIFAIDPNSNDFISVGGGQFTASGRGGGGDSKVHRQTLRKEGPVRVKSYNSLTEIVWENADNMLRSREDPDISAMAVSNNAVFLGFSILGPESDRVFREGRKEMPHRLRVLDIETGELIKDYPIPAQPVQGGISLANGKVYVTTTDGTITVYGIR